MKVVAIVIARMGSTRLPGKVLLPILGKPLLLHMVERIKMARGIDEVIVATANDSINDPIREICKTNNVACYSGSENDVLDRFYQAAKSESADVVLRITGDCPLVDPKIIETLVSRFTCSDEIDYLAVATGAGAADKSFDGHRFPDGMDTEIFSFKVLETAWKEAKEQWEREHTTPFIWKRPERFRLGSLKSEADYSTMRWTVDNKEDFELIEAIYNELYPKNHAFGLEDVIIFLKKNPKLLEKNSHFIGKEGYDFFWGGKKMSRQKGLQLWEKAKKLIPGGTQLLSKRSEMFLPDQWPSYFDHAKGVEIWDLDGNKYIDMSLMGVSACTLGYADDDVDAAVKAVITKGQTATLNSPEEVELAELLIKLHPWAQMVRYTRSGGEAVAVAIRIARAHTRKDKVAFCGYHGWHDWYLAANLANDSHLDGNLLPGLKPLGVPRALINTNIPFEYNNIESLKKVVKENEIGVIIMEPSRHGGPQDNFLQKVRALANEIGAVLIFDEISSGFKQIVGGVHLLYGVNPDIAVFSKMISNGYPMAAVIGTKKVMDAAQDTFISSVAWTERIGPTAAIATITKMLAKNVPAHLDKIGGLIGDGWTGLAKKHGLKLKVLLPHALITFVFEYENKLELKTLFIQEMLKRGFLCSDHVFVCYAHQESHVQEYLKNVDEVFGIIKDAIDKNNVKALLEGPVCHSGFKRLVE